MIDFARVSRSLRRLDALAADHPRLVSSTCRIRLAAHVSQGALSEGRTHNNSSADQDAPAGR